MSEPGRALALESDNCIHIFWISAAMVGVCLSVIGLLRIVISVRQIGSLGEGLLAANAVLFVMSCLTAYRALRTPGTPRMMRLERVADLIFTVAMLLTVSACMFVAYSFTAQ